mgnify:CR=1 FL=1
MDIPLNLDAAMCVNRDACIRLRQITVSAVCAATLRKQDGDLLFEQTCRRLARLRAREPTILSRRLRLLGARGKLLMEEIIEEDLERGCVCTKAAYMQLQHCDDEEIPSDPGHIVSPKVDLPAVVGAHGTQSSHTVSDSKDAEQGNLLAHLDAKVPVQESRQYGSDQVLDRGDDACREDIRPFVEAAVFVPSDQLAVVRLVPER